MKVKFIGETFLTEVWRDRTAKRSYKLIKNRTFKTDIWWSCEAVLTARYEFICDIDSQFFKDNFEVVEG